MKQYKEKKSKEYKMKEISMKESIQQCLEASFKTVAQGILVSKSDLTKRPTQTLMTYNFHLLQS